LVWTFFHFIVVAELAKEYAGDPLIESDSSGGVSQLKQIHKEPPEAGAPIGLTSLRETARTEIHSRPTRPSD
jgi:hypothetical protein